MEERDVVEDIHKEEKEGPSLWRRKERKGNKKH